MFAVLNVALAIVVDSYIHVRGNFGLFVNATNAVLSARTILRNKPVST